MCVRERETNMVLLLVAVVSPARKEIDGGGIFPGAAAMSAHAKALDQVAARFTGRLGTQECSIYSHGKPRATQLKINRAVTANSGSNRVYW